MIYIGIIFLTFEANYSPASLHVIRMKWWPIHIEELKNKECEMTKGCPAFGDQLFYNKMALVTHFQA